MGVYFKRLKKYPKHDVKRLSIITNQLKNSIMEDFKNIIALLNNPETRELGATLAVSQGLDEKIKAFYCAKFKRKNYKYKKYLAIRSEFYTQNLYSQKSKQSLKKHRSRNDIDRSFSNARQNFLDVIISINKVLFPSASNVLPF